MTEITIPVSGDMEPLYVKDQNPPSVNQGFEFAQIPNIPLDKLGYPKAHEWIQHRKANVRPWALFLNYNNFRAPPSIQRFSRRFIKNIEYFQNNYLFVFAGLVIYCLITSPLLLLTVAACLGTCYKVSQKHAKQELMMFGKQLTLAQVYSAIAVASLPLFYLVGAGAALFWVLGVSFLLITIHAAYYNIDTILCPGEEELTLVMQQV